MVPSYEPRNNHTENKDIEINIKVSKNGYDALSVNKQITYFVKTGKLNLVSTMFLPFEMLAFRICEYHVPLTHFFPPDPSRI